MPSLRAISALVLMAFLLAGTFLTLRQDLAQRKAADEAALTTLASIWQEHQMPMPPERAPLERFEVQRRNDWQQFTAIGFPLPQGPTGMSAAFEIHTRTIRAPAIMVDGGNLGHPEEAARIATETYRQQLAESIAGGVENFRRAITKTERVPRRQ